MESVGPVDSGHKRALPDFSRIAKGKQAMRIVAIDESSQTCPRYPQPVRNHASLSTNALAEWRAAGVEIPAQLVVSFIPWFMPVFLHRLLSGQIP